MCCMHVYDADAGCMQADADLVHERLDHKAHRTLFLVIFHDNEPVRFVIQTSQGSSSLVP